jgi:hypothetical protein
MPCASSQTFWRNIQPRSSVSKSKPSKDGIAFLCLLLILYKETVCSSETLVNYRTTWRHIPQDNPSVHIWRLWKREIYNSHYKIWGYHNNAISSTKKFHELSYVIGHDYLNFRLLSLFWKKKCRPMRSVSVYYFPHNISNVWTDLYEIQYVYHATSRHLNAVCQIYPISNTNTEASQIVFFLLHCAYIPNFLLVSNTQIVVKECRQLVLLRTSFCYKFYHLHLQNLIHGGFVNIRISMRIRWADHV